MTTICKIGLLLLAVGCSTKQNNSGVHIMEDKGYESLQDIVKQAPFRNKTVYVDIWGTRCIPCITEFTFNTAIKNKFAGQPIEYLYLAVDYGQADDRSRWLKMISENKLTGYNMMLSGKLYENIWKSISDKVKTMYLLPHYMLVDKHGNIAIADAPRPSKQEKLYKQIRTTLNR